jgi:ribonuclease Z
MRHALMAAAAVTALFGSVAASAQTAPTLAAPNELSVLLCGTGSPLPDKSRAGPCTLIAAADRYYLVDTGLNSARNLALRRIPTDRIAGILLTHSHSDHIAELGEIRLNTWVAGRAKPLAVYGPPGVAQVVHGFNAAYALDADHRVAHHGAELLPPEAVALEPMTVPMVGRTAVVLNEDGLKITAVRVHHDPVKPAYGYRFDFAGRSVVVSGDTAPDDTLAEAAKGADVLVHEALSPQKVRNLQEAAQTAGMTRWAQVLFDIPSYHTSPVDAAHIANAAGAKLLVVTHLIPQLRDAPAEKTFLSGVDAVRKDGVRLGRDGLLLRLPGGSDEINESDQP